MGMFGNLGKWTTKTLGISGDVGNAINKGSAMYDNFTALGQLDNLSKGKGIFGQLNNSGVVGGGQASYPQSPYTMTTSSQNGSNYRTSNFGYDAQGRPNALPFESIRDGQGNVGSNFKVNAGAGINPDLTAYNSYLGQATRQGPTDGALAALNHNTVSTQNNLNNVNMAGATAQANAFGQLQQMGGMSANQRERVAMGTNINTMRERMNALNNGNMNASNILMQDGANKTNMLGQAHNMSMGVGQFGQNERDYFTGVDKYNNTNLMNDLSNFNNYNSGMWNETMNAWGASKQADAQARASAQMANQADKGLLGLGFLGL